MEKAGYCPYCGNGRFEDDSMFVLKDEGGTHAFAVKCVRCRAEGPAAFTQEEAVQEWNKRMYSWDVLMEILDRYYPADVFADSSSRLSQDAGAKITAMIREINELRKEREVIKGGNGGMFSSLGKS